MVILLVHAYESVYNW